jgi:hypothetical protein
VSKKSDDRIEALKAMIESAQVKCMQDGLGLCAYFLEMAAETLKEDTAEVDLAMKANMLPLKATEVSNSSS